MAKQNSLPSVDEQRPLRPHVATRPPEPAESGVEPEGYLPRRVDVKLPLPHRRILRDKLRQLQNEGAKLADGTEVSDKTKAVLWMLEHLDH